MRQKIISTLIFLSLIMSYPCYSNQSAPQIVPCDYKIGRTKDTAACIVESVTWMGEMVIDVKVNGLKYRSRSSEPNYIDLIDKNYNTIRILSGHVEDNVQCRNGSFERQSVGIF